MITLKFIFLGVYLDIQIKFAGIYKLLEVAIASSRINQLTVFHV
jgi:hypothetical protein